MMPTLSGFRLLRFGLSKVNLFITPINFAVVLERRKRPGLCAGPEWNYKL